LPAEHRQIGFLLRAARLAPLGCDRLHQVRNLELITIVAASAITNYTASITKPPLEPALQPHAWSA
jgi:hypothetical protein